MEGNDSPRPAIWIPHLPPRTVGSQLQLSRVRSRAGRHSPLSPLSNSLGFLVLSTYFLSTALPAGLLGAAVLFRPLLLQPVCLLACLLSRNSKVGSQGLSCVLASAFSIQLLREALTGYISWFHFLPFLLWRAARKLFLVGFLDLGMALLLQNRRVGIYFTLLLNWKKPS